ncbi:23635_t:CDS:2 [Cetraspora pellucida]|uniref:23635_t:CDS:1 n=1 Tax=Cetraspora pellucida TaxID=1433469 RepID=A0A9N9GZV8_9GLOM|nr:23635_t:CDS:2 [Cetraspora pellucida]
MFNCFPKFADELTKFRQLWWDQGNIHPKANWENAPLPYELKSNVSWDKYVERTDKHNVHGMWEWNNGKVFVYELPSAPHESACAGLIRLLNFELAGVFLTDYDFIFLGSMTTKAEHIGKEADGCLRPEKKLAVDSDGCDGLHQPWPNLVVEVAYSESEEHLFDKIKNYWLRPNRAHDVIAIKIEPPKAPETIPSRMTAWYFCTDNRMADDNLDPIEFEFGTIDKFGNQLNIQPGQCIINIRLECLYMGMQPEFQLPTQALPNPISIDLYPVRRSILSSIICPSSQ